MAAQALTMETIGQAKEATTVVPIKIVHVIHVMEPDTANTVREPGWWCTTVNTTQKEA